MEPPFCPPAPKNWALLVVLVAVLLDSRWAAGIRVIGGNETVVIGKTVVLPCHVTDTTESITQISWQKRVPGVSHSDNFFTVLEKNGHETVYDDKRFSYAGSLDKKDGSLRLSSVTLEDEAIFVCIFTMFPSGNYRTEIPLTVLVPPTVSVKDDRPTLGDATVSLATCRAAASKPPTEVRWITDNLEETLNSTSDLTRHDNGTATTTSTLRGAPIKGLAGHMVHCEVTSAGGKTQSLPFVIQVYFAPTNVTISETEDHSFECRADGYPEPHFTWFRHETVVAQSPVLSNGVQDGLYRCEAVNSDGSQHAYLFVTTRSRSGPCCGVCCTLLALLLFAIAAFVGFTFYRKRGREEAVETATERHCQMMMNEELPIN